MQLWHWGATTTAIDWISVPATTRESKQKLYRQWLEAIAAMLKCERILVAFEEQIFCDMLSHGTTGRFPVEFIEVVVQAYMVCENEQ